jgi:cyclopropane-fatty-acyl-phospholipid synthase
MAQKAQIEETYNYMDELFRLCYGECGDCSGAMYDLDFRKSLEEAQKAKHDYILANLEISAGTRVLDVGCGWGPMLKAVRDAGAHGVGLTLSTRQAEACRRNGLEAHVLDWREVRVETLGKFDAVVSVGSFEHFCSREEFLAGRQESIYIQFFEWCSNLLPEGGRLFLQTMLWGRNAPRPHEVSMRARRGTNEYIVAVLEKFYPGSWLPSGVDQIIMCAEPYFEVLSLKNGRLDYIETMNQWSKMWKVNFATLLAVLKTSRYFLLDRNFRYKMESLIFSYNRECFKREVMDHQRIVLRRK